MNDKAIEKNIAWYLRYSKIVMVVAIIFGIISIVVGLVLMEDTDLISIMIFIPVAIIVIGWGILFSKEAEWKAYMLQSTHEINKKVK